ncbi:MAG: MYG1 family protein [Dehalococcoidales bacterium]|nr:MAG: MYG1 family protein [Dehalococcoidales bacterium]
MKEQKIITHPGSAHFDDVTAVSLVLAVYDDMDFHIERREPILEELEDPDTWVIDIGDRYEPEKHNFDHHQSLECPASFVLVAEYLGLTERLSIMPWWDFKDEVDRYGTRNSSIKFDAGDDLVNRNPVEDWLTAHFASDVEKTMLLLKSFGKYLIEEAEKLKSQIEVLQNGIRLDIAGVPAVISETRETIGLEEFRRLDDNPPDIVVSMDRRDDGWRIFRYDGAPVDLTLISGDARVSFAHKSGFLAKTRENLPVDDLIDLISNAVVKNDDAE